jgi:hypothetical protein
MDTERVMTCDSCGAEHPGATKRDVLAQGWKFHLGRGGVRFVMCWACEAYFAPSWAARAGRGGVAALYARAVTS